MLTRTASRILATSISELLAGSAHLVLLLSLFPAVVLAQAPRTDSQVRGTAAATTGGLKHYDIKHSDQPPPKLENEVNNGPQVVPQPAGAKLNLPPGFAAGV